MEILTTATAGALRLEMRGVRKRFGATVALNGVDLAVAAGEVMALVGENGAGKSTLMKVLSGAHAADAGTMMLDGAEYAPRNPLQARARGVAMIYQELSLAPHLSVMENIVLGVEPTRGPLLDWARMRQAAGRALAEVGLTTVTVDAPVRLLSPAHQQLVEIARAVALESRVLVLDEPTSSLSQEDRNGLFALIARLKARGMAIVYISHFLEELATVADRFTVLRDGETVGSGAMGSTSIEQVIALMVGRDVRELYPRTPRTAGETLVEVRDLAGMLRPASASLTLRRGEVLGICGLMGAGRTELVRALFGLDSIRRGTIRVGAHTGWATPDRRWAQRVGMVSEDRKAEGLALGWSIADNVTLARLDGMGPAGLVRPSRQRRAARDWIDRLSIKCAASAQAVGALSGGNQQKVALARLLHADVDVLLLDEPTRGIDVGSKAQIYQLIDELAARGKAVLLISSYLPELLGTCDRIAVMCRGRLGESRPRAQWDEHRLMQAATGQEAA